MNLASTSAPRSSNRCTSCRCGATIHAWHLSSQSSSLLGHNSELFWCAFGEYYLSLDQARMVYSPFMHQEKQTYNTFLVQNLIPELCGRREVHLDRISAARRSQERSVALRVALLLHAPAPVPVRKAAVLRP